MWLERFCESIYNDMKHCLSLGMDGEHARANLLHNLCIQLTGRNSTTEEQQYLRSGGLLEFEVLLHGYLMERRDWFRSSGPVSLTPPCGVVRKVGNKFKPVAAYRYVHDDRTPQAVGVAALLHTIEQS